MSLTRLKVVAIAACLTASLAAEASAWGPDGHRMVCRIAWQLLDAPLQTEIRRLTSAYRTPDGAGFGFFTDGCVFPDEARSKARDNVPGWDKFDPFETWHFLNVPRTTNLVQDIDCHGNCVLTGIAHHAEGLTNASTDEVRAEALFFLGHWVGDIHQPLHISYTDDLGGNNIKPINGGFYASGALHAVWDSGIIAKAVGSVGWRIYADRLAREITPAEKASWIGGQAISWAQESYPDHQTQGSVLRLAGCQRRVNLPSDRPGPHARAAISGRVRRRCGAAVAAGRGTACGLAPATSRLALRAVRKELRRRRQHR